MDAAKWPKLTDIEQLGGSQLTQEEDLMDDTYVDERVVPSEDEEARGWVESISKKKKRKKMKKKTNQVAATRASARVPRDGVPIVDKAMARAKERNNFLEGNCSNSFTVLKDASTTHLRGVMLDLDITCDDIDAQIDAFRAEEAVRADLAKANYQVYLENLKKKIVPQGEDDLGDLTMEVISNANRNVDGAENDGMLTSLLPKGGSEEIPLINN
jgi:DNA-binding FrmR family transcriptional regulator